MALRNFQLLTNQSTAILKFSSILMPPPYLREFRNQLSMIKDSPENHTALIITSNHEKIFSNGLDIEYICKKGVEGGMETIREYGALCADLMSFPIPVIAAMNGHTFAGGVGLAMACDWRVMRSDRGYICLNEIDVPIAFPRLTYALFKPKLPKNVLSDVTLRARRFNAPEALSKGLVDELAPQESLLEAALSLADRIGPKDRFSYGKIKEEMYKEAIKDGKEAPMSHELESWGAVIEKYGKLFN